MTFIELLNFLEDRLGYHQFPVNVQAKDLAQVFDSSAIHHDFAVKLVHEIYKANHCQNLRSPIDQDKVEEVLVRLRADALDGKKTDIDLYHFIEDICVVVYEFFTQAEGDFNSTVRTAS